MGAQGATGNTGAVGASGRGISSVMLTSGNHAAGTTDTYTITFTDSTTMTFGVYNGANGTGAGDMLKTTYDTNSSGVVDNAEKVNGLTVLTAVPSGAVFTDTLTTVNGKTGAIAKADIVAMGIPAQDTTYSNATTGVAGLESTADKAKLDAITGINTGDETAATIKTKLGITTLSGSNTGDQTLSGIGGSNKNILHNWDFRNPVNQRGQTSYTSNGYSIDRWCLSGCSLAINAGVGITLTGSGAYGNAFESVENYAEYKGKTVTFAVSILDGTGVGNGAHIGIQDGINEYTVPIPSTGYVSVSHQISSSATKLQVEIVTSNLSGKTLQVESVKLELGSVSTLANDAPADFGEQLALCQRLALELNPNLEAWNSIGCGVAQSTTVVYIHISTPVTMRIIPSCTDITSWFLEASNNYIAISSVAIVRMSNGIVFAITSSGLTVGQTYNLKCKDTNKKLFLSADL